MCQETGNYKKAALFFYKNKMSHQKLPKVVEYKNDLTNVENQEHHTLRAQIESSNEGILQILEREKEGVEDLLKTLSDNHTRSYCVSMIDIIDNDIRQILSRKELYLRNYHKL